MIERTEERKALPIVRPHEDNVCGLDEQGSEILAPALGDAAEDRSAACAVLAWHETKPCAEIASALTSRHFTAQRNFVAVGE